MKHFWCFITLLLSPPCIFPFFSCHIFSSVNSASTSHIVSFHFSPSSLLTSKTQLVSLPQTIPPHTAQICFLNLFRASLIHDSETKTKTQRQNSPYSIDGKKEISCHWRGTAPVHLSWHMKMMEEKSIALSLCPLCLKHKGISQFLEKVKTGKG